jgi:excisionase family DNA binding protein
MGGAFMDRILVSVAEAGNMLSLGRTTIYQLISEKKIATVKIGRRRLIRIDSIRRLAGEGV